MNLNETDRDVSTEVAFPVPPYDFGGIFNGDEFPRPVENFRVWVDGREIKYQSELKAMVRGVDFSARLRQLGIDIVSFGHFDDSSRKEPLVRDFERLSKQQQSELRRSGFIR